MHSGNFNLKKYKKEIIGLGINYGHPIFEKSKDLACSPPIFEKAKIYFVRLSM
jgi:hypothetical protein